MPSILSILSKSSRKTTLRTDVNYLKLTGNNFFNERPICSPGKGSTKNSDGNQKDSITLPPEPQECCMSGCTNCVWVKYAEEVAKQLGDGGEHAKAKIMQNVKDPNLRAFLLLELNHLFKNKDGK